MAKRRDRKRGARARGVIRLNAHDTERLVRRLAEKRPLNPKLQAAAESYRRLVDSGVLQIR